MRRQSSGLFFLVVDIEDAFLSFATHVGLQGSYGSYGSCW